MEYPINVEKVDMTPPSVGEIPRHLPTVDCGKFSGIVKRIYILYLLLIFFDSLAKNKSLKVAALSVATAVVQITGYGTGFMKAVWYKIILRQPLETKAKLTKLYNRG